VVHAPSTPARAERPRADRCPGALVLHEAADGGLARIRLPGGLIDGRALAALAALAASFGERGAVELTSRGNLQVRGVPADRRADLADEAARLGLLPSATHERVRNIVASPLAGLTGPGHGSPAGSAPSSSALAGLVPAGSVLAGSVPVGSVPAGSVPADGASTDGAAASPTGAPLDDLVHALDEALCADPDLALLSGRFLFGLDDATGDIAGLSPDAWAVPATGDRWWVGPAGVEVDRAAVVPELLTAARAFLRAAAVADADLAAGRRAGRSTWRIRDLPDGGAALAAFLSAGRPVVPRPAARPSAAGPSAASGAAASGAAASGAAVSRAATHPLGVWRRPDGRHAAAVHVPLGRLTRAAAELLAAAAAPAAPDGGGGGLVLLSATEQPLRITPWRSVVVPHVAAPDLADPDAFAARARQAGLVTDPGSLWARVTACAGLPGCASALADVRADAARAVAAGEITPPGGIPPGAAPLGVSPSGVRAPGVVPPGVTSHIAGPVTAGPGSVGPLGASSASDLLAREAPPAPPGARAHWSGCARRCGRPAGPHVEVVAGPGGYLVRDAGADQAEPKEPRRW